MTELYLPLVERAFRTAAVYHRDQCRKQSVLPYVIHPAAVLLLLQRAGIDDEEILAAALLHDVVEDTPCTLEELSSSFPPNVLRWVEETSETKLSETGEKLSWMTRKQAHLQVIATASWQARAIVLADKLHNLASMLFDLDEGEDLWSRFGASPDRILWYNREMVLQASQGDSRLEPLRTQALAIIDRLCERSGFSPASL